MTKLSLVEIISFLALVIVGCASLYMMVINCLWLEAPGGLTLSGFATIFLNSLYWTLGISPLTRLILRYNSVLAVSMICIFSFGIQTVGVLQPDVYMNIILKKPPTGQIANPITQVQFLYLGSLFIPIFVIFCDLIRRKSTTNALK